MLSVLYYILSFIVVISVLIVFHEFGHFIVARFYNVKVLRFSVGFGNTIYRKYFGKDKTEFVIAMIPLGGYVKMLDEQESPVATEELSRAFSSKPLLQRFIIVLAGPMFNLILAVILYWLVFMIGVQGLKPLIKTVEENSIAEIAGMSDGQQIMSVNEVVTPTWSTVTNELIKYIVHGEDVSVSVQNQYGVTKEVVLKLSTIDMDSIHNNQLLEHIGIMIDRPSYLPIISEVLPESVAEYSGFQSGDRVIMIDSQAIHSWSELVEKIQAAAGSQVSMEVVRDGATIYIDVKPDLCAKQSDQWCIGVKRQSVSSDAEFYFVTESYSFFQAFLKGVIKVWDITILTFSFIGQMITGDMSIKNLNGPISIAEYAGKSAERGFITFISFMALISISIGVINLLPIPLLDGGHLLYYIIEFVVGRPLSLSYQVMGQKLGFIILLIIMFIAFYNDIVQLF